MCELLIWTRQRAIGEHVGRPDRGGVTCVKPDGWQWGREEIQSPNWRIVKLPGVPVSAIEHLTQRLQAADGKSIERYKYTINLTALEKGLVLQPQDALQADLPDVLSNVGQRIVADPRIIR